MIISYVSLGCPKNQIDLEIILGGLAETHTVVTDPEQADVIIVNTCAFIESAKQESIDSIFEISRLKQQSPDVQILVTGCLSQRYKDELARQIPEVDQFFYTTDAQKTLEQIQSFLKTPPSYSPRRSLLTLPHYAYLQIAEGCNNRCSYCAIPLIKGDFKSRQLDEIVREAQALAETGVRELLVVAQDSTFYGRDLSDNVDLSDVLVALHTISDFHWIRLLYTHPAHWDFKLMEAIADLPRIVKYVDLPVQHISDPILKRMGRGVTRREIQTLIQSLRKHIPDLALRTSVITGFPGETSQNHQELLDFIRDVQFERLGAFTYSHEDGTRAFELQDAVSQKTKMQRLQDIMELQSGISQARNQRLVGSNVEVLVDETSQNAAESEGRTQWDAPEIDNTVRLLGEATPGRFYSAKITAADTYDLDAEILEWIEIKHANPKK